MWDHDREPKMDESKDNHQSQVGEPVNLLGWLTGGWVRGYLQEHEDSKAAALLTAHPSLSVYQNNCSLLSTCKLAWVKF